jgi:hypothetical protein
MRIITHTCETCGTIVSANELESNRVMKCPGLDCESVLRFNDLSDEEQEFFVDHADQYKL